MVSQGFWVDPVSLRCDPVFVEFDFVLPVGGLNDSFVDLERYPFGLTLVTCLFESWFVDLERYPFGLTLVT